MTSLPMAVSSKISQLVSMWHLVDNVRCCESKIAAVMGVLPNVLGSLLFVLHLYLVSSAPIGQKTSATEIQTFDSLDSNLPATDDADDALGTNGFIFEDDDVLRQVEDEIRQDDEKMYEEKIKDADMEGEENVDNKELLDEKNLDSNDGKREESDPRYNDAWVGGTSGCHNQKECATDIFGEETCWYNRVCSYTG